MTSSVSILVGARRALRDCWPCQRLASIKAALKKLREVQEHKPVSLAQCPVPNPEPSRGTPSMHVFEWKDEPLLSQHQPWFVLPSHSLEHLLGISGRQ